MLCFVALHPQEEVGIDIYALGMHEQSWEVDARRSMVLRNNARVQRRGAQNVLSKLRANWRRERVEDRVLRR